MVGCLAAVIGVLFFVAVVINYPFGGGVSVKADPFERVSTDFGR